MAAARGEGDAEVRWTWRRRMRRALRRVSRIYRDGSCARR